MSWQEAKAEGNAAYTAGRTQDAIAAYTRALQDASIPSADRATVLCNRAQAQLRLGNNVEAVEDCTACLTIAPDNVKALFRRAAAYEALGEKTDALRDFKEVLRISPGVTDAVSGVKRLESELGLPSSLRKKPAATPGAAALTEEDKKQLVEVQERVKDVAAQKARAAEQLRIAQREKRSLELTTSQVSALPEGVRTYRAIGKAFLATPRAEMTDVLREKSSRADSKVKTFSGTLEYLEQAEREADAAFLEVVKAVREKTGGK